MYIAHIAAETFTCGTIPVMATLPGEEEAQEVHLPTVGSEEPRVLLFHVLSCMEALGIQMEMAVSGVWFAIDSVPAQFIKRREAREAPLDWARPDAGQLWEEWGEEGRARFGVDGVEVIEDRPLPEEEMPPIEDLPDPNYPFALSIPADGEDTPSPDYPIALAIPVDDEERNRSRSPSSFVDDETQNNMRSASMLANETPDTTRSPEAPRVAQGSAGPRAAGSSMASAARATQSAVENENDGDENENEEKSAWKAELENLINEEMVIVAGDAVDAPKNPSLGHPSPMSGLFIYDSCNGMW